MIIIARTLAGTRFEVAVEASDAVCQVKAKIEEQLSEPLIARQLIARGIVLEDERTIADHRIRERDSVCSLSCRLTRLT